VYKIGISSGKITQAGESYRAKRQLDKIAKMLNLNRDDLGTAIIDNYKNRARALDAEKLYAWLFRDALKHSMQAHKIP
jgi:hypothetical protein